MIGVFDSGVGGLTVVKEIFKELPNRRIIYFGDTARLPYGTKGPDFVKKYSTKISAWLLSKELSSLKIKKLELLARPEPLRAAPGKRNF